MSAQHLNQESRSTRAMRVLQPLSVIGAMVLLLGVPFWMVVVTAGKNKAEAATPDLSLPAKWQLFENFAEVFTEGQMVAGLMGNTLILLPTVLLLLLLGSMASWVLARRTGKRFAVLYAISISGIILPPAVVTLVLVLRQMGLAGTPIGLIGAYMGIYLATVIFFVTGFVRSIPLELEEAARIDGAGATMVYFRIVLPLLTPVLSTAAILLCLYIWNDVFYALFIVGGRLDTLPLNLYQVASAGLHQNNWHLVFAYIILMSLPLLAVFLVLQRKIISGVTSGAVK